MEHLNARNQTPAPAKKLADTALAHSVNQAVKTRHARVWFAAMDRNEVALQCAIDELQSCYDVFLHDNTTEAYAKYENARRVVESLQADALGLPATEAV